MKITFITKHGEKQSFESENVNIVDEFGKQYEIKQDYDGGLTLQSAIQGFNLSASENEDGSVTVEHLES